MVNVKDRLIVQKREIEERGKEPYIERDMSLKGPGKNIINVIMGPRRAGKSTFAFHELLKRGPFGYVNFDDEKLIELEDYDDLIEKMNVVYNNPKTLFLDEIQNLKNWELFVNRLQRQGFDLVISGSNANILSKELATYLTGRHLTTTILPLSFSEFLEFFKEKFVKGDILEGGIEEGGQIRTPIVSITKGLQLTEAEIKAKFDVYLEWGGYPEPLVKNLDHKDYLSSLFDSVIYKDIVKRFKVRNPSAFENLALYVISHASNAYSYNTLAELTKVKSPNTVEKYLAYLEEAFLIFRISRFSLKMKSQIKSDKKIYCIDNGLLSAKGFRIFDTPSEWHENVAAVHLWKKHGKNLFYYKSQQGNYEIDFAVREGTKITQLIQISYDLNDQNTRTREFRALVTASKDLGCDNLLVLTHDYEAEETFEWFGEKRKIKCVPLWKWLPIT